MSKIDLFDGKPFYDCNIPPAVEGYICEELSDNIYRYEKIVKITRIEVVGKDGREFVKRLKVGYYEISIQDCGKTIKIFERIV